MTEVVALGSLLADQIIEVNESFLEHITGKKGGMEYASVPQLERWIELSGVNPVTSPGGSAANVLRGMAHFGRSCALFSQVGSDPLGNLLIEEMQKNRVAVLGDVCNKPTGRVLSMVTPDGQRTMRTHLGASEYWESGILAPEILQKAKLFHFEAYSLDHEGLTEGAMKAAKEAGALVSFDLSSFEVTARHKDLIMHLIHSYVDILIANEEEAKILGGNDPKSACDLLKDRCRTAVVTMGKLGCWVGHEGVLHHCPINPVCTLDSTGAGDLFASGFLHGFLDNLPVRVCAHIGSVAARAVVQVYGANLPAESWAEIRTAASNYPVFDKRGRDLPLGTHEQDVLS